MSPLIWTGIACAALLALMALWAWLWRTPRIRSTSKSLGESPGQWVGDWPDTDDRIRSADEGEWQDQALHVVAEQCCDLHNRNCEPPSELCCWECTEAEHPLHRNPADCIAPDLSAPFDVIAEPDHRRAEHMNRTLRLAEGGDEHG